MAFELENNLVNNPPELIALLWEVNPQAVQNRMAGYGIQVSTYGEVIEGLQEIYDSLGLEGVQDALTVNLIPREMTAPEIAAIENLSTVGQEYDQRSWELDATDGGLYGGSSGDGSGGDTTTTDDGDHGEGQGWEIVSNILGLAGTAFNAFFGDNNNQQPSGGGNQYQQPPQQSTGPNWPLIIGLGLLGLALIVLIIMKFQSNRGK